MLKWSRHIEARILCSIFSPFSRLSFSPEMRAEKADSWNSASGSEESAQLNHATVVRQTLTMSKLPEAKHLEMVPTRDFFPLLSSATDKFLNHSSFSCSLSSYIWIRIQKNTFSHSNIGDHLKDCKFISLLPFKYVIHKLRLKFTIKVDF